MADKPCENEPNMLTSDHRCNDSAWIPGKPEPVPHANKSKGAGKTALEYAIKHMADGYAWKLEVYSKADWKQEKVTNEPA